MTNRSTRCIYVCVLTYEKLNTSGPAPSSFALDESSILTVSELYLGQLEGGGATNAVPLPAAGMRLAPSQLSGTVYLFGGTEATERRVYLVQEDGSLTVYVATAREILRLRDGAVQLVIRLPDDDGPIVSLAALPDDETLVYSTADAVYAVHGLTALAIVTNAGGTLRSKGDALYLLDTRRPMLAKLTGIRAAILSPPKG